MSNQDFRLFINNITENINEDLLRKKLSQFGDISSIQIKQRENIIGNQTPAFAYVNINTTPRNIQECFKDFSTQKFENVYIDISIAKESFMERLKREREINYNDNQNVKSENVSNFKAYTQQELMKNPSKLVSNNTAGILAPKGHSVIKNIPEENHFNPPLNVSEQKRIHSILQKTKEYHSQKLVLQNALSRIDLKPKSKVVFNENKNYMMVSNNKEQEKNQEDKFQLFNDDDNETNSKWFQVKEHFEGIKGQKLFKLQSRFKNDPRFSMDARFLDSDISEEANFKEEDHTKENDYEKEKKEQIEILEEVLGKKIMRSSTSESTNKTLSGMLRYDPDHEDHLKYEMTSVSEKHDAVADNKKTDTDSDCEVENSTPQVSKEKFYKVTENLKDALFTGQQFSMLETFGAHYGNKKDYNEQNAAAVSKKINKNQDVITNKPFQYDSSSDSEDDKNNKHFSVNNVELFKSEKLWTESFFFKNDDYRLQEGFDFVKRLDVNDATDFVKLRRNIKEAAKVKIKNNQKKFSPFKRKLGQMKRIKIKRALKR